jgi:hypothetical protein
MKAFRLTRNDDGDYDLLHENGTVPQVEDGSHAAQLAEERLSTFVGEYSLDGQLTTKTTQGTRWYEIIFNMSKSRAEKEFEIKRRILGTPGIVRILEFDWNVVDHTLYITGRVLTDWGEEDISTEITPL